MNDSLAGKIPGYETVYITSPELTDEGRMTLQEKLQNIAEQFQGVTVLTEDWGKRKMAYPIQKETRGNYFYFVYTGKPGVVHEVERNLRLQDKVLRFLTINLESEFDADQFRKQRADLQAAAKRREEERESRREERGFDRHGSHHGGDGRRRGGDSAENFDMDFATAMDPAEKE